MWTKLQIEQHKIAAQILIKIKDEAFEFIKKQKNVTEYKVQQFIIKKYKENNLVTDKDPPIVAFDNNTSIIHYFPTKKSKKLVKNTLILLDLWAKVKHPKAPFADITWMAYFGKKVPKEVLRNFDLIKDIRNSILRHLKKELKKSKIPKGYELEQITRRKLLKKGFKNKMNHYTGHCLGNKSPHGKQKHLDPKNKSSLLKNLGYTIEPGIYLPNKHGVRSEIDFYITKNLKLVITTDVQKKIIKI